MQAHGTTPNLLIPLITRKKIVSCPFWAKHCGKQNMDVLMFKASASTANQEARSESMITYVGGVSGTYKQPTPFLCYLYRLLELKIPCDEAIRQIERLSAAAPLERMHPGVFKGKEDGPAEQQPTTAQTAISRAELLSDGSGGMVEGDKHMLLLFAFYLRFVGQTTAVYSTLEPLLLDYRRVKLGNIDGSFTITHVDEVVYDLLTAKIMFTLPLPSIPPRGQVMMMNPAALPIPAGLELTDDRNGSKSETKKCVVSVSQSSVGSKRQRDAE